ncbi:MAG: T9SS type B sorting domain-containing protein, partial [Bacteroidota bacterium]
GDTFSCSDEPIPALTVSVQQGETANWYDAPSGGNLLASNTTSYTPTTAGTYYAEANVQGIECASLTRTAITLSIFPSISFNQPVEEITICDGENLQLLAEIPNVNYSWSTGENTQSISISEAGNYTVTATTDQNCSAQKTFIISSTIVPEIVPISVNIGENFTIETTNQGEFEFSVNGIFYQDSSILRGLPSGIVTVFARNINGCPPSTMTFYNIATPTYFTPNSDGINDLFTLPDLSFFASSELKIFDRFGKLLFVDSGPSMSWDGTFNGEVLPVDDYWYTLTLDTTSLTGNVSLLLL